jgi:hypothetical protein
MLVATNAPRTNVDLVAGLETLVVPLNQKRMHHVDAN